MCEIPAGCALSSLATTVEDIEPGPADGTRPERPDRLTFPSRIGAISGSAHSGTCKKSQVKFVYGAHVALISGWRATTTDETLFPSPAANDTERIAVNRKSEHARSRTYERVLHMYIHIFMYLISNIVLFMCVASISVLAVARAKIGLFARKRSRGENL